MRFDRYKLLVIGIILAVIDFAITVIYQVDLFEKLVLALEKLEKYEIDEFILPIIIILIFAYANEIIRRRNAVVENEKLKIYQAMVWSSQHVLNNFLNQMMLFKLTADDTPNFDPKILLMFDEILHDAEERIEALSNIAILEENEIRNSVVSQSGL